MRVLALVVLWLSGLSLFGFGVAFIVAPLKTMASAGIVLESAVAATELRAFYGGLEVALGALVLACALLPARRRDGLILTLAVFAAIGVTRLAGMMIDGADSGFLRFALASELGLAVLAGACLRAEPR
jgi:hypothetical protein